MSTLHTLTRRIFKSNNLLQSLLLIFAVASLASCAADKNDPFYFDVEAQKVRDEAAIRQYFRDNNIDTLAVERSESGLYYLNVIEGEGAKIEAGDSVSVHYVGKYLSNIIFDSSYSRAKLLNFVVEKNAVIDGMVEGIQKMNVGGEAILFIPSHLAYGPFGGGSVPGNTVLIFNLEAISKKPGKK